MKDNNILKNDFSDQLLKKIKKEKVKQVPKNIFVIKNIFIWIFLVLSIFVGALSLSITFEYLFNADWFILNRIGFFKILIVFMPFFWLLFLIFSIFLSYYNFRHTKTGYKISFIKVFLINTILSLSIGIIFYFVGIHNYFEEKIENHIPKYRSVLVGDRDSRMLKVWQNEEKGLLIGKIKNVRGKGLDFIDFKNKEWMIILDEKTDIKKRVNLKSGERIKILGKIKDQSSFIAEEIRPFRGIKK